MIKVAKFGGTSLADGRQIKKALDIVHSDPSRQYVVVSAPGKRWLDDLKVTDLLYAWHQMAGREKIADPGNAVADRFLSIVRELDLKFDVGMEIREIRKHIGENQTSDYTASRGEYLSGKIMAAALGYEFVDPAQHIKFSVHGDFDKNYDSLRTALEGKRAVIPGFYGSLPNGLIKTFPRGGSDITGAIVSRAVGADVYENWTDVSGLLSADPRIVNNPRGVSEVSYRELRELAYMGANVFHEEAMFPVLEAGITTRILNTNDQTHPGTSVVADRSICGNVSSRLVTGIAGRKNFSVINVEKMLMNREVGFARRILSVLEKNRLNFEHMPSGIDTISIIIDSRELEGKLGRIVEGIRIECRPDNVTVNHDMSMIAVVGQKMAHVPGVAAKVFGSIASAGINVTMINQGASEMSILIGVQDKDCDSAIRAVYNAFFS